MELLDEIKNRVSASKFKKNPIKKDIIERILEAGQVAPSAKNRQPWRFVVITDEKLKEKIKEFSYGQEHVGDAPVIVAACSTNIEYTMPNGQAAYPIDISFAVSFMTLQAQHEGLGSCVVTMFNENPLKEILSIPYPMRIVMLLLLGYSDDKLIIRDRKQIKQISSFNHW
jgi:nitroreductase